MPDQREERTADRVDRLASQVLGGRHLKPTPSDAGEREAIQVAARLAGVRDGYPRMSPAFRRRLARMLEQGQETEAQSWMDRRAALVAGLGLAVGAIGGVLADEMGGFIAAHRPAPSTGPNVGQIPSRAFIEPRADVARWVDSGLTVSDLVENVPRRVTAGAVGVFLIRRGSSVVAMSSFCTHLPCELVWKPDQKVLNCPCHNLAFDLDGESLRDGYPLPALPYVKTRVRADGHVEVLGT